MLRNILLSKNFLNIALACFGSLNFIVLVACSFEESEEIERCGLEVSMDHLNSSIQYNYMQDPRDGELYRTVIIGSQEWMAENLRYDDGEQRWYENSIDYEDKFGNYYTWNSAAKACPTGWHLPSQSEWQILFDAVGGQAVAGKMLKSQRGWHDPNRKCMEPSKDPFGFTAIPAGGATNAGFISGVGSIANYWGSEESRDYAVDVYIRYDDDKVLIRKTQSKIDPHPIRCVKGFVSYGDEGLSVSGQSTSSSSSLQVFSSSIAPSISSPSVDVPSEANRCGLETSMTYLNPDVVYGSLVDSRDGYAYRIVAIGQQFWFAENLRYDDGMQRWYSNEISYEDKFGGYYPWKSASTACPSGWRLPTKAEWQILFNTVGGQAVAGKMLKSQRGWHDPNRKCMEASKDPFGFTAIPAGSAYNLGFIDGVGKIANYWTGSEDGADYAYDALLTYDSDKISFRGVQSKIDPKNVRCIYDPNLNISSSQVGSSSSVKSSSSIKSSSSLGSSSSIKSSSSVKKSCTQELNLGSSTFVDCRDKQTYRYIIRGNQLWMTQNLNYDYSSNIAQSFCYENSADSCKKYGRLYQWRLLGCNSGTLCNNEDVCPIGWRVPTYDDWMELIEDVGGENVAGVRMKSSSGWYGSGNGSNITSFAVLPAGSFSLNGFENVGKNARFWSQSSVDAGFAKEISFSYSKDNLLIESGNKDEGLSVRCVRNLVTKTDVSSSSVQSSSPSLSESCTRVVDSYTTVYTDCRDYNTYKVVKIGRQLWMADNLNYEYSKGGIKSYCFNNSADSCKKYGRLYTWGAAMDSVNTKCGYGKNCSIEEPFVGICPEGFRLPSESDWKTLIANIGGDSNAGNKLKSTFGWNGGGYNNGLDSYSFRALPAGMRGYPSLVYSDNGTQTCYWMPSEYSAYLAKSKCLNERSSYVNSVNNGKGEAWSIRCMTSI